MNSYDTQGREVQLILYSTATQELEHMLQACTVKPVYELFIHSRVNGKTWDDLVELNTPDEDYRLIMKLIEATVEAFPRNVWSHCFYARALWAYDKYAEAVKELQVALRLEPHNAMALSLCGESYYLQEDYESALRMLHEAIKEAPLNSRAYYALALTYRGKAAHATDRDNKRILYSLALMDLEHATLFAQGSTPYFDHVLFETRKLLLAL